MSILTKKQVDEIALTNVETFELALKPYAPYPDWQQIGNIGPARILVVID